MLVIEDDANIADIVTRVVRQAGLSVLATSSVLAAKHIMLSHDIALVIADVHLPGGRAPELLAQLRDAGVACPVLFISGDTSVETVDSSLAVANASFLPKPFSPDELRAAIALALRQA